MIRRFLKKSNLILRRRRRIADSRQGEEQTRQGGLHSLPYQIQIDSEVGWHSYRLRFRQNLFEEFLRDVSGSKHIHAYPEQTFQLALQAAQIEQCRSGKSIHQNVKIAPIGISSPDYRTKHARIRHPVTAGGIANGTALQVERG